MQRVLCGLTLLALLVGAMALLSPSNAADEKKDPSVKEIMTKAHKGADSLLEKLKKELNSDEIPWDAALKQSKDLVKLGTSLGKAKPPKGDDKSWAKLTKQYLADAQDLEAGADNKDKEAAKGALTKLTDSCAACHKAHKPAKK